MGNTLDIFTIGIDTNLDQFEEQLKKTEKELKDAEKEVKAVEESLKQYEDAVKSTGQTNNKYYNQLKKQLSEAKNKVELFSKSVDTMKGRSEYQLLQLRKNFTKLTKTVAKLAVVGVTLKKSLDFYEQAEQLDFLAQKTGVASEKLQELANVTKRYGGTTEGTAGSVENIRTNREEYTKAGIRIEEDPAKTLENVARKMEKLKSDTEKWQFAESLGIDEATTRLLIEGVDKYNESLKKSSKYKLYTKEDIQRMREYRQIQQDIRDGVNNIFGAIYRSLLPAIIRVSKVIRNITDWLTEHQGAVVIVTTFLAIAAAINILSLASSGLNKSLVFLSANLAKVRAILGWAAVLTAVFVYLEDLYTFIQGGDSVLGDLWKSWGCDLDKIRAGFEIFAEKIQRIWRNLIHTLKGESIELDPLEESVIKPLTQEQKEKVREYKKKQREAEALDKSKDWSISAAPQKKGIWENIKHAKNTVKAYNNNMLNSISQNSISNFNQLKTLNDSNFNKTASTTNNRNINLGPITIKTQATEPRELAQEIASTMVSLDNGQIA